MNSETYQLSVCGWNGNPRYCVYLNGTRIAGQKPWGGATSQNDFTVTRSDILDAISKPGDLATCKQSLQVQNETAERIEALEAENARLREAIKLARPLTQAKHVAERWDDYGVKIELRFEKGIYQTLDFVREFRAAYNAIFSNATAAASPSPAAPVSEGGE